MELFPPEKTTNSNSDDNASEEDPKSSHHPGPQELGKLVLPQWCKNYPKLTADDSRKVREQTQVTHSVICKAVGRNLAPFLKQLVPHWYLAHFDIYAPVASAAKKSYQSVFPNDTKQVDVVKHCIAEIIAHVSNNLDTVFRVKKPAENSKKTKGGNKKNAGAGAEGNAEDATAEKIETPPEAASSKSTDSENFEIRTSYATLQAACNLINLQLVNEEFLEFLFGKDGVFWDGAEFTKDILVSFIVQLHVSI